MRLLWQCYLLILLATLGGSVFAQSDLPNEFISEDGKLSFRYPAEWSVHVLDNEIMLRAATEMGGSLYLVDIREFCGSSAFAVPTVSCTPSAAGYLDYEIRNMRGLGISDPLPGEIETFTSAGRSAAVFSEGFGDLMYALDVGDARFVLISSYVNDVARVAEYQAGFEAVLESLEYDFETLVSSNFPTPQASENALWMQNVIANEGDEFLGAITVDADEQIYVGMAQGAIRVLDGDGNILHDLTSSYLSYPMTDLIQDAEGQLWALTPATDPVILDVEGHYLESYDADPGGIYEVVQLETDGNGNIYLLELGAMTVAPPRITVLSPERDVLHQFEIGDPETFPFMSEAFLSMDRLAVSPDGTIYVFAEWAQAIRVFDVEGQILVPSLVEEISGRVHMIAVDEVKRLYVATSAGLYVYDETGMLITNRTEPALAVVPLRAGEVIVLGEDGTVQRMTLE